MKHDMVSEPKVSSSSPGLLNLLKIAGSPLVSKYEPVLCHTLRLARRRFISVARVASPSPSHTWEEVLQYM